MRVQENEGQSQWVAVLNKWSWKLSEKISDDYI